MTMINKPPRHTKRDSIRIQNIRNIYIRNNNKEKKRKEYKNIDIRTLLGTLKQRIKTKNKNTSRDTSKKDQ